MRITPLDVRKQEFRRTVRGFDCDEVRAFMATLADEYEIVLVDNKQLREKMIVQEEEITKYQSMERTLRDTLMTAEKLMQETRENANKEGDLILQDAKIKGKGILQEYRHRAEELRRELETLRKEKERYLGRFKSMAESQIQFIESHRTDFKDVDDRLDGIVDSVIEGVSAGEAEAEQDTGVESIIDTMIQPEGPSEPQNIETPTVAPTVAPAKSGSDDDVWRNYNPAQPAQREQETGPRAPWQNAPEAGSETPAETPADPAIPAVDPFAKPEDAAVSLQESIQDAIPEQPVAQNPVMGPEPQHDMPAAPKPESAEQGPGSDIWQGAPGQEHPYFPAENSEQNGQETDEKNENDEQESKREDIFTETLNI